MLTMVAKHVHSAVCLLACDLVTSFSYYFDQSFMTSSQLLTRQENSGHQAPCHSSSRFTSTMPTCSSHPESKQDLSTNNKSAEAPLLLSDILCSSSLPVCNLLTTWPTQPRSSCLLVPDPLTQSFLCARAAGGFPTLSRQELASQA